MNYFSPQTAAERYAKGRPAFHSSTIEHIGSFLQLNRKLERALDVACGTGLSTKALLGIAEEVYGTDISEEMLKWVPKDNKITYALAPAEKQPFPDRHFDLITVSSGVHWFDIDRFLSEADRLLKSRRWLVLYENHFISEMEGNPAFSKWFPHVYLKKFPSPPRNNAYTWTQANLKPRNFDFVAEEKFKNPISFNKRQLALYFTTQSNVISAVQKKRTTYGEVEAWLDKELTVFFESEDTTHTIFYGNWIKYLQRAG